MFSHALVATKGMGDVGLLHGHDGLIMLVIAANRSSGPFPEKQLVL